MKDYSLVIDGKINAKEKYQPKLITNKKNEFKNNVGVQCVLIEVKC